jgi:Domain of unknown function (DUF4149)
MAIGRVASVVALLAIAVWLGGLLALGALAAPVVFTVVPLPMAADAMTVVFQRFDIVAMTCAALILLSEALRAVSQRSFARVDIARGVVCAIAAALAVVQGAHVSPRIASLHAVGVSRGLGASGMELSRLHDLAELLGQAQVILLATAVTLHVAALSQSRDVPRASS